MDLSEYNNLISEWLDRAFTTLLMMSRNRLNIRPQDKVGISFIRNSDDRFSMSFRRFDQYDSHVIISAIARVLQSNEEFLFVSNKNRYWFW